MLFLLYLLVKNYSIENTTPKPKQPKNRNMGCNYRRFYCWSHLYAN